MKIALCDDNHLFLNEMQEQLQSISVVDSVQSFEELEDFLDTVRGGTAYDAVLMDIDWNRNKSGIQAAEELYRIAPDTKVIYVTGYTECFVQQVFLHKANLSGFLSKPVEQTLLQQNLDKVKQNMTEQEERLVIRSNGALFHIPVQDIHYIESQGHTVLIHTEKETITAYEKLNNLFEQLPESFCQCHKSYIVNMHHVRRFQGGKVLLKSDHVIPISRSRNAEAKERYFSFIGQQI